jgi:TolA-binding protein
MAPPKRASAVCCRRRQPARRRRALLAAAAAVLALLAGPATGRLFDDDEARKAILDLRARVAQNDEQSKARIAELAAANAQLLEQMAALRRSLLDLNNQLELLRGDMAKLRGSDEQTAARAGRPAEAAEGPGPVLDDRLRKLEPVKVTLDGREFAADPDERKAYDDAVALMRGGDFDKAAVALAAFQRRFPNSGYADSVRYWLGNAQYARRDYKEAIATFRAFVAAAPEHRARPRRCWPGQQPGRDEGHQGRAQDLDDLIKAYPKSEAAQAGKERLAR